MGRALSVSPVHFRRALVFPEFIPCLPAHSGIHLKKGSGCSNSTTALFVRGQGLRRRRMLGDHPLFLRMQRRLFDILSRSVDRPPYSVCKCRHENAWRIPLRRTSMLRRIRRRLKSGSSKVKEVVRIWNVRLMAPVWIGRILPMRIVRRFQESNPDHRRAKARCEHLPLTLQVSSPPQEECCQG